MMGREARVLSTTAVVVALHALAKERPHWAQDDPVTRGAIAERAGMGVSYVEALMRDLDRAGLCRSVRGRDGGHLIVAERITLADIRDVAEAGTEPPDIVKTMAESFRAYLSARRAMEEKFIIVGGAEE